MASPNQKVVLINSSVQLISYTPPEQIVSSFKPSNISGNAIWVRSDLGISLNSGNVSAWADQSGTGNDYLQSSGAKQPAYFSSGGYNNLPYVGWTSNSAAILKCTLVSTINTPWEYFFVADYDGTGSNNYGLDFGGNSNAVNNDGTSNQWSIGVSSGTSTINSVTINVPHVASLQVTATTPTATFDGSVLGSNGTGTAAISSQIGSYGGDLGAFSWGGKIYEVIAYNRALTSGERGQLAAYFLARYGVA